jgi:hypothetical protein
MVRGIETVFLLSENEIALASGGVGVYVSFLNRGLVYKSTLN